MRQIELVPGWSLRRYQRAFWAAVAGFMGSAVLFVVFGLVLGASRETRPWAIGGLAVWIGFLVVAIVAMSLAVRRRLQEADAGYTTAPSAFINLATVDDRTGFVLREAGEPLLTSAEYEARCRLAGAQRAEAS